MTSTRSRAVTWRLALVVTVIPLIGGCGTSAGCLLFCDANDDTKSDGSTWNNQFNIIDAQANGQNDGGPPGQCTPTNGGNEICDGVDNNCNGQIDEGFDLHDPYHCGSCTNNCYTVLANAEPSAIKCQWSGTTGQSGTCSFTGCAQDWFDLDKDPTNGCEYPCTKIADDDTTCNNRDDDCDGLRDEDVNLCTSVTDCGRCGGTCVVIHGSPACIHDGAGTCDSTNTHCSIQNCDDDNGDGSPDWWDLDKSYATGCEYHCIISNGGVEICGDGLDNDCDGKIDDADDLSGDKQLGVACTGSTQGACAAAGHEGKTTCVGNKVVCTGADVIQPSQLPEICDGIDNDCNGIIDDALTDVGGTCGTSSLYPCSLGTKQCVNGAIVCVGAVEPGIEYCNGLDDDCNGKVDDNPVDSRASCGHPTVGACQSGIQTCNAGAIMCTGGIEPKVETCNGIDDDCNGIVDDNIATVGSACGPSNAAPCRFGTWQCNNGQMACVGSVEPQAELCDGVDNNCDGQVDNGIAGLGDPCGSLQDSCVLGTTRCAEDGTTHAYSMVCTGRVPKSAEVCNGKDDDCNGLVDDNVTGIGQSCGKSATAPCRLGTTLCTNGAITCTGNIDPQAESCDGVDNDCNGVIDDSVPTVGQPCGASNTYPCSFGTKRCQTGQIVCVGANDPSPETCNGIDDDCDGVIDATASSSGAQPPADSTGACDVPAPPPSNATTVCKAGTKSCQSGTIICQGSVKPATGAVDACGVDTNCDGQLTNQPNLQTDVHNCGSCGNDCYAGTQNEVWTCQSGSCKFDGCTAGFYDHDSNPKTCEYSCTYVSAQESCNGKDDNCDGQVDENVTAPAKPQTCGISPSATRAECTTQVSLTCQNGAWKCVFPAGVCAGGCSPDDEVCDELDNDCDGLVNENVSNYAKACASDDAKPVPGDGACRTTGTYVCNGPSATKCSATRADCSTLPGGCTELCDGVDNDCDGAIDETTFEEQIDNYFVKPAVVQIGASLWMFKYEASRPTASATISGTGNGYFCTSNCRDGSNTSIPSAPTGVTLDKTRACSTVSRVPWFNVTPIEAEQTCAAIGGHVCTLADWQTACHATSGGVSCLWGYDPRSSCRTSFGTNTFCNLGVSYQGGLLSTASTSLKHCSADWSGLQGNPTSTGIFDITGNLREITRNTTSDYRLMGGAFSTDTELGATCDFTFYSVAQGFRLFDTGFRCCFASDPTI